MAAWGLAPLDHSGMKHRGPVPSSQTCQAGGAGGVAGREAAKTSLGPLLYGRKQALQDSSIFRYCLDSSIYDFAWILQPPWPNGQGVRPLIRRLRARAPQGVLLMGWRAAPGRVWGKARSRVAMQTHRGFGPWGPLGFPAAGVIGAMHGGAQCAPSARVAAGAFSALKRLGWGLCLGRDEGSAGVRA